MLIIYFESPDGSTRFRSRSGSAIVLSNGNMSRTMRLNTSGSRSWSSPPGVNTLIQSARVSYNSGTRYLTLQPRFSFYGDPIQQGKVGLVVIGFSFSERPSISLRIHVTLPALQPWSCLPYLIVNGCLSLATACPGLLLRESTGAINSNSFRICQKL